MHKASGGGIYGFCREMEMIFGANKHNAYMTSELVREFGDSGFSLGPPQKNIWRLHCKQLDIIIHLYKKYLLSACYGQKLF